MNALEHCRSCFAEAAKEWVHNGGAGSGVQLRDYAKREIRALRLVQFWARG